MNDLEQAIDPDTLKRQWTRRIEYHLDLVPKLLGATITLATPAASVTSLGPRVTGGGYRATVLAVDEGAGVEATYLWSLFSEYATAVSDWLGAHTVIPSKCPNTSRGAHDSALIITGTLLRHTEEIWDHRQLDTFEQEMFGEIRRMQRRYLPTHEGVQQHARACTTCGEERAVRVVWVDGANGSPKPEQVGKCRVCGEVFKERGSGQ